jgi:hypothetical protein
MTVCPAGEKGESASFCHRHEDSCRKGAEQWPSPLKWYNGREGTGETDLAKQTLVHPLLKRLVDSPFDTLVLRIEVPVLLRRVPSVITRVP